MYKTIIIDDEEPIRTGLRDHFDWERHGVHVEEVFPDCAQAYQYICTHPIDLVVTDVITPYMDGITLAQKLRKEFPAIQVVFISGHADVQLLREALKIEAINYILKSVDLDELSATITRVVRLLDSRHQEKQRISAMEEQLQKLIPMHRERLLRSLLSGDEEIRWAPYLGLDPDGGTQYVCMVVRTTREWQVLRHLTAAELITLDIDCEQVCNEAIAHQPDSLGFKNRSSEYVIALKYNAEDYEQDVLKLSEQIQNNLKSRLNEDASIGIGEPAPLSNFHVSYDEACEAIEQRYYLSSSSSVAMMKYPEMQDQKEAREFVEKHLSNAIASGDPALVKQVLRQAFVYIRAMSDSEQDNFMLFLLLLPSQTLPGLKVREGSPYRNQRQLLSHWLNCPSRMEQEQFLMQIMTEIADLLQADNGITTVAIVQQVISIIDQEYMEQISVASLAAQVHLTPTYLCVLFKQATGKTINEYLTSTRIHHAKLLLTDWSVRLYDVCYRVGYLSPSYFSKLFKKQVGMTPGEYRQQVQNGFTGKGST